MINRIVDRLADRIRWGYFTAFILLLSSYILTFYTTKRLLAETAKVSSTTQVINNLDLLLSSIKDGELSLRGFMVIHDESFLDLFSRSSQTTDSIYLHLKELSAENSTQQKRLDTLKELIDKKYFILRSGLNLFKENNLIISDSVKRVEVEGKLLMDVLRDRVSKMKLSEKALKDHRDKQLKSFSDLIRIINIISLIVAITLAFYSLVTFNSENRAKRHADSNAEAFRQQLELRIAELNMLNSELIELKSIEKFASTGRIARTIAHEVRNPLTNINLATEHLRSEIPANSETDLLLEMITRNSNRINRMISDLLNSTKESQLDFQSMGLNNLLDESLELAADRIELKEIKVIKEFGSALPLILVDPAKIKIAFLNVIVNAIEAMQPSTGVLKLKTYVKNNRCIATITDNGKGMDKEELTNLFEPYFTTKESGTGLGLTNTQNIILSHKANITAESTPGVGTTFIISFNYSND